MGVAKTQFIFGTDHAHGECSADFCLFDCKALIIGPQGGTNGSYRDLLSGRHIGSSAHNLYWLALTQANGAHCKLIGIGVFLTAKDFSDYNPFQSAFHRLHLFQSFYLQSGVG